MYNVCERNSLMRRKYLSEMKQRKELHNQLVDLRGNIRVFCRIRPVIGEDGSGTYMYFHGHATFKLSHTVIIKIGNN